MFWLAIYIGRRLADVTIVLDADVLELALITSADFVDNEFLAREVIQDSSARPAGVQRSCTALHPGQSANSIDLPKAYLCRRISPLLPATVKWNDFCGVTAAVTECQ